MIENSSELFLVSWYYFFFVYWNINTSSALFYFGCYYFVLYRKWSTFLLTYCSSADIILYYIEKDQHFLVLVARQLVKLALYWEWSSFLQPHCSSASTMLNYIQNEQYFLGHIARRLVLYCVIYRMINISWSSLLVGWYYVVLYREWS